MDIVRILTILFERVFELVALFAIMVGMMAVAFDHTDHTGAPVRSIRRITLAAAMTFLGVVAYVCVPIVLNELRYTPSPGHVRFYGLFFAPIGFVVGILAVLFGVLHTHSAAARQRKPPVISLVGVVLGYVTMWLVFFAYSRIVLGAGGILYYALLRSTLTAFIGAAFFAVAPRLVHHVDNRPVTRFVPLGYALVLFGLVLLVVTIVADTVLSVHINFF